MLSILSHRIGRVTLRETPREVYIEDGIVGTLLMELLRTREESFVKKLILLDDVAVADVVVLVCTQC